MAFYVHNAFENWKDSPHVAKLEKHSYYVAPFESYFLVTGFPQSAEGTRGGMRAEG